MINVTALYFHEKVSCASAEVTLIGQPNRLRGKIEVSNLASEKILIREIPLRPSTKGKAILNMPSSLRVNCSLDPEEKKVQNISLQLPAETPPGDYQAALQLGGKEVKVRIVVQPRIQIELYPRNFHFLGVVPGQTYKAELCLTNSGNLPFKVPKVRHGIMLDEDFICRAQSFAMKDAGSEGFLTTLDAFVRNVNNDMADWVSFKLKESGKVVEPGCTLPLHFSITLPKDVVVSRDYVGDVRIWNKVLTYKIKSH